MVQILGRWSGAFRAHGFSSIVLVSVATAGLVACGQKGPLFMPPPPKASLTGASSSTARSPASPASAPTESSNDLPAAPPASGPTTLPLR
ncbi:hypothetical protein B0B52_13020 [Polaromonas sp. A23]|nr:hypothetical protein B0B52_13020 [Polaromonas sp. A23]